MVVYGRNVVSDPISLTLLGLRYFALSFFSSARLFVLRFSIYISCFEESPLVRF